MRNIINLGVALAALVASAAQAGAQAAPLVEESRAAYVKVTRERAAKIVAPLGLVDTNRADRVRDIIAQQYQDLSRIHDARDQRIEAAQNESCGDKTAADAAIQMARDQANAELDRLHTDFLAKLNQELSLGEVEQVKDGMTYGVVNGTYKVYLVMYPELTPEQKKQLRDWLVEAREIAMDQGSSKEKHAVFGKYKGRINNYLVKAGYDLKQGEQNLKKSMQNPSDAPAR